MRTIGSSYAATIRLSGASDEDEMVTGTRAVHGRAARSRPSACRCGRQERTGTCARRATARAAGKLVPFRRPDHEVVDAVARRQLRAPRPRLTTGKGGGSPCSPSHTWRVESSTAADPKPSVVQQMPGYMPRCRVPRTTGSTCTRALLKVPLLIHSRPSTSPGVRRTVQRYAGPRARFQTSWLL